ncbi:MULTISPECIES: LysR substrate-binding domain-containing protein [Rhodobacterales]|uniref:LysR substrate-binding domain-containing protein n=1 Tax=Roseobacter sp. N2S TaxID=2663844 RepID=UPI00285832A9|nr:MULTISPECIES: LysR substrate-binding domain-containing protein [Rhodobacterales]MDR6263654.1 LysR family hydrogen peroxide-inducible transcriptional activator [Roseobacter sp. N2S]
MKISLRHLSYFRALCQHGHFGHAADAANVSQPALSVKIQELEDILQAPLIDRTTRPFRPTPYGNRILDRANRILADVQALEDSAQLRRGVEGPFALGVIPTVAPYLLPAAIPLIQSRLPQLDLQIREGTTDELLDELDQGKLDACVIATEVQSDKLQQTDLFADRFLLAIQAKQADALGLKDCQIALSDIAPLKLLLLSEGHCLRDQAKSFCQYATQETLNQIGASSLQTLAGLAAAGYGATLIPEIAFQDTEFKGPLAVLRIAPPEPERNISFVTKIHMEKTMDSVELERIFAEAGALKTKETREKLAARTSV